VQGIIAQKLLKRAGGGRIAAHEILLGTPAIRNLIREGKIPQISSMMQMGSRVGMVCMSDAVNHLLETRQISSDVAREALHEVGSEPE